MRGIKGWKERKLFPLLRKTPHDMPKVIGAVLSYNLMLDKFKSIDFLVVRFSLGSSDS